jgi:ABC-2 type transport system permease protein
VVFLWFFDANPLFSRMVPTGVLPDTISTPDQYNCRNLFRGCRWTRADQYNPAPNLLDLGFNGLLLFGIKSRHPASGYPGGIRELMLRLYLRLIGVQIRSQMQYRVGFALEAISTALITGMVFITFAFVIERFGNIAGWSLGEVGFLYGLIEFSFGLMDMLFSGFDPQNFGRQVRLGRLDQILLRPIGVTVQIFGSDFILRRIGRIAQGLVIFIVSTGMTNIQWTFMKVVLLPVVIISQVLFFGGLFIIGATITFWTFESIEVVNIFTYGGAEMMSYPMNIYPNWMRKFFTYIIPAIFINYYPALYILNKPDPLGMPGYAAFFSPLVSMFVFGVSMIFWQFGLKHYQSTGT